VRLKSEQEDHDKNKDYCDAKFDAPLKCSCSPSSLMNSSCSSKNEQKEDDHKKHYCDAGFDAPLKCSSSPLEKAKIVDERIVQLKNEQKKDDHKKDYCDAEFGAPLKCSCSPSSLMNSSCGSRTN